MRKYIIDPLTFLLDATGIEEERCFPIATRATLSQQQWLPVLKPYIERIAQTTNLRTVDIFARPYAYFYQRFDSFFRDMLPPIHVYTKNVWKFSRTGLALQLGDEYITDAVRLAAIAGIADSLIGRFMPMPTGQGASKGRLCHRTTCPLNNMQVPLCQGYVAFPPDDYRKCKFPEFLEWLGLDRFFPSDAAVRLFSSSG